MRRLRGQTTVVKNEAKMEVQGEQNGEKKKRKKSLKKSAPEDSAPAAEDIEEQPSLDKKMAKLLEKEVRRVQDEYQSKLQMKTKNRKGKMKKQLAALKADFEKSMQKQQLEMREQFDRMLKEKMEVEVDAMRKKAEEELMREEWHSRGRVANDIKEAVKKGVDAERAEFERDLMHKEHVRVDQQVKKQVKEEVQSVRVMCREEISVIEAESRDKIGVQLNEQVKKEVAAVRAGCEEMVRHHTTESGEKLSLQVAHLADMEEKLLGERERLDRMLRAASEMEKRLEQKEEKLEELISNAADTLNRLKEKEALRDKLLKHVKLISAEPPAEDRKEEPREEDQVLNLNVGGEVFQTHRSTLQKYPDTLLGAMFSKRNELMLKESETYFFDRDPNVFPYILDFYRNDQLVLPSRSHIRHELIQAELEYFNLPFTMGDIDHYKHETEPAGDLVQQEIVRNILARFGDQAPDEGLIDSCCVKLVSLLEERMKVEKVIEFYIMWYLKADEEVKEPEAKYAGPLRPVIIDPELCNALFDETTRKRINLRMRTRHHVILVLGRPTFKKASVTDTILVLRIDQPKIFRFWGRDKVE